jgi:hypothetical protein
MHLLFDACVLTRQNHYDEHEYRNFLNAFGKIFTEFFTITLPSLITLFYRNWPHLLKSTTDGDPRRRLTFWKRFCGAGGAGPFPQSLAYFLWDVSSFVAVVDVVVEEYRTYGQQMLHGSWRQVENSSNTNNADILLRAET